MHQNLHPFHDDRNHFFHIHHLMSPQFTIFLATSGHSGVDRIMGNLITQCDQWSLRTDVLTIAGHGPHVPTLPHIHHIPLGTRHVMSALPALTRYLRQRQPTALLCDKDRVNRVAILANHLAGHPSRVVVRIGTAVSTNLAARRWHERELQRLSMHYLYPRAHAILVPSAGVADDLAAFARIPRPRISVVASPTVTPQLLTDSHAAVTHPWFADGELPVILGVGELSERKDFATLIRATALVRQQRPCRLVLIGRGRRAAQLQALAHALGIGDDVALLGFQSNPYAFMRRAAVFVLPSRWEGMPVALIEALATHTPVIATDCPGGGAAAVLHNNEHCGSLIPVGDVSALATAMIHWLDTRPTASAFEQCIAPYHVAASTAAYLRHLGIPLPAGALHQ